MIPFEANVTDFGAAAAFAVSDAAVRLNGGAI